MPEKYDAPIIGGRYDRLLCGLRAVQEGLSNPGCGHIDRSLNIGSFSRLREINTDASFSVIG